MIIDTHCHYNLEPLYDNWQDHWQKAQGHGVGKSIVVGTDLDTSKKALEISAADSNLYATIGIHPNSDDKEKVNQLGSLTKNSQAKLVAIGETGLDYYRLSETEKDEESNKQKEAFIFQLQLAEKLDLPLVIHVRDKHAPEKLTSGNAYWDVIEILKKHHSGKKPFILHCVSGPSNYLKQALELGAYIGIAGNVTYPNAQHLRELVKLAPTARLLLETDAPFLTPQEFRGQKCEPWMIKSTAEFVERELGVKKSEMLKNSDQTFLLPRLS